MEDWRPPMVLLNDWADGISLGEETSGALDEPEPRVAHFSRSRARGREMFGYGLDLPAAAMGDPGMLLRFRREEMFEDSLSVRYCMKGSDDSSRSHLRSAGSDAWVICENNRQITRRIEPANVTGRRRARAYGGRMCAGWRAAAAWSSGAIGLSAGAVSRTP